MDNILFTFIYLLIPVASYQVLKAARVDPFRVTVPSIFFWYYLMIAYIGILPIWFDWTWYDYIDTSNKELILAMYFYSASCLLLVMVGFFFMSRMRGSQVAADWTPPKAMKKIVNIPILILVLICAAVTALYLRNFSSSVMSLVVSGEVGQVKEMRSQMGNDFAGQGRYHYYSIFFKTLLPFCVYLLLAQAIIVKRTFARVFAFLTLGGAVYATLMAGEKAPIIWLLCGCFLVYIHARKGNIRPRTVVAMIACTAMIIVGLITMFVGGEGRTVADLSGWIVSRIFVGGIVPAYFYLQMFPGHHEYLWGASLPNPRNIFPWEHYRLTVEVSEFMKGGVATSDTVGSAPTAFWAEAFVNFGPTGPLIVAPIIGIIIYIIHILLGRLKDSPIKTALIVWVAVHFMKLAESGITGYLLDLDLLLILFISGLLLVVDGQVRLLPKRIVTNAV